MFFPIIKKKKNNDIGTGNDFYLCLPACHGAWTMRSLFPCHGSCPSGSVVTRTKTKGMNLTLTPLRICPHSHVPCYGARHRKLTKVTDTQSQPISGNKNQ